MSGGQGQAGAAAGEQVPSVSKVTQNTQQGTSGEASCCPMATGDGCSHWRSSQSDHVSLNEPQIHPLLVHLVEAVYLPCTSAVHPRNQHGGRCPASTLTGLRLSEKIFGFCGSGQRSPPWYPRNAQLICLGPIQGPPFLPLSFCTWWISASCPPALDSSVFKAHGAPHFLN